MDSGPNVRLYNVVSLARSQDEYYAVDEATNERSMAGAEGVATVQVHLPPFRSQNPTPWFTRLEAIFDLRRITSQRSRFLYAVTALSKEVVTEFHDVLDAPHGTTLHGHLRRTVLQHKSMSVRRRLQQLLNEGDLGDRPSINIACIGFIVTVGRTRSARCCESSPSSACRRRWLLPWLPHQNALASTCLRSWHFESLAIEQEVLWNSYIYRSAVAT
ncbi:hypothetical protein HPB52_009387 [Rhipicephalus sanguineus]|uniref:DUF7041 domain-containing protein n=1 Tax=Rhipicephalus sanguineus TaxID=34632 RepID=A0A9D4PZ33_RHISA|nr:hypothetical protein HPB52_009387 [Rhipicephalus sanguineus]